MKKLYIILIVLTVLGCTREVEQYHISQGIKACGSSDKIDYIDTFIPLTVVCNDGTQVTPSRDYGR